MYCTTSGLLQYPGQMWTSRAFISNPICTPSKARGKTTTSRPVWCTTVMMQSQVKEWKPPVKFILVLIAHQSLWLGSPSTQYNHLPPSPDNFWNAVWLKSWCWQLQIGCGLSPQELLSLCKVHTPPDQSGLLELIVYFLGEREGELYVRDEWRKHRMWLGL